MTNDSYEGDSNPCGQSPNGFRVHPNNRSDKPSDATCRATRYIYQRLTSSLTTCDFVATQLLAQQPDPCPLISRWSNPISSPAGLQSLKVYSCFHQAHVGSTTRINMSVGITCHQNRHHHVRDGVTCHSLQWDLNPRPPAY